MIATHDSASRPPFRDITSSSQKTSPSSDNVLAVVETIHRRRHVSLLLLARQDPLAKYIQFLLLYFLLLLSSVYYRSPVLFYNRQVSLTTRREQKETFLWKPSRKSELNISKFVLEDNQYICLLYTYFKPLSGEPIRCEWPVLESLVAAARSWSSELTSQSYVETFDLPTANL